MIVEKIEFDDVFAANCYFYVDEKTKEGFIIDPSAHADKLLQIIKTNHWDIQKILLTHSHIDHIGAALELAKALNIKIFGYKNAQLYLSNLSLKMHLTNREVLKNMQYLDDTDEIYLKKDNSPRLKVIATPGHTLDSVVYYDPKEAIAFSGDTIFASSIGRTDLEGSGGNHEQLIENITQKILTLNDNTILYPGHGPSTTVAQEKKWFDI